MGGDYRLVGGFGIVWNESYEFPSRIAAICSAMSQASLACSKRSANAGSCSCSSRYRSKFVFFIVRLSSAVTHPLKRDSLIAGRDDLALVEDVVHKDDAAILPGEIRRAHQKVR
jgi:hypothetical protein